VGPALDSKPINTAPIDDGSSRKFFSPLPSKVLRWGRAGMSPRRQRCFIALDRFHANRKMVLISHE
jgi:hypothetical protein